MTSHPMFCDCEGCLNAPAACSPGVASCRGGGGAITAVTPTVEQLVAEVSAALQVAASDILGRSHEPHIVRARHQVWRRVRTELAWSYPVMARHFHVDHSTIQAALKGRRDRRKEHAA